VVEDAVAALAAAYAAGIGYVVAMGAPAAFQRLLACNRVAVVIKSLRDFPRESAAGSQLGESGAGREGSGARATVTSDPANPSGRLARGRHAIPGYGLNPSEEFT
jgi:hypothetical protein